MLKNRIKQKNGFTLIEALISVILLSIFALMLVQGIRMAVIAFNINKVKTRAVTIANEEIEKIKSMSFNDIGFSDGDPQGVLGRQKYSQDDYLIEYNITYVNEDSRIKQVTVSVYKEPMADSFEVVTEIAPLTVISEGVPGTTTTTTVSYSYLPPQNLEIVSDTGSGNNRRIVLEWEDPYNPDLAINSYNIYRNSVLIANTVLRTYEDRPGNSRNYSYYVTIIYSDGTESAESNEVATK